LIGPDRHAALFSERREHARPAPTFKYEVFNDIIRNKPIEIRMFSFSRCSSGSASRTWPHYMCHG